MIGNSASSVVPGGGRSLINTGIFGIFARGGRKHIDCILIAYSGLIQEVLEFLLGEGENIIIDCILRVNTRIFGIFARGGRKHIDCILRVTTGIFARGGGKHIIDCILWINFLEFLLGEGENISSIAYSGYYRHFWNFC